jgi:hypothetical protein
MDAHRANRLLCQLLDSKVRQHTFQPDELEFLLDLVEHPKRPRRILRQYQRFIARGVRNGESTVPKLDEFLESMAERRASRAIAKSAASSM